MAVQQPADANAVPSTQETIADWVHCHDCDYPLLGLPSDGRCPECGASVADSTRPTVLRNLPIECVAKLRRSTGAIGVALVAAALSLPALILGWEILCMTGPLLGLAVCIAVITTDLPRRLVPAHVEFAAHSFATSVFLIPLFIPFVAAVATGANSVVASGLPYYERVDWPVLALARFFIGLAAGLVPFVLIRPLGTYARLIGEVFGDHPGRVTSQRIHSIRRGVRTAQILGITTGLAATFLGPLKQPVPFVLAVATALSLLFVAGQSLPALRDARRSLKRVEAESHRRAALDPTSHARD